MTTLSQIKTLAINASARTCDCNHCKNFREIEKLASKTSQEAEALNYVLSKLRHHHMTDAGISTIVFNAEKMLTES